MWSFEPKVKVNLLNRFTDCTQKPDRDLDLPPRYQKLGLGFKDFYGKLLQYNIEDTN